MSVQNPLGNLVTTLYNAANWIRATVNPLGYRTTLAYNGAGWQTAVVDGNANRTTTVFDGTGRRVVSINTLGYRVTHVYDAAGRRTAMVDARSSRYTFVWDVANRQIRQVDHLSRSTTYGYNAASEQVLRIDARGFRTTYVADNLSRPIGRQYPDGSRVTMAYDAVSNRTLLADSTGRYTTLYDKLNRARAVTNPAQLTVTYSFDSAGRRASMVEPFGGRFTYGYSPTNLNTLVINPQGERTTWQFDSNSRVTVQRLANLIRVSYAYDDANRLIRLANLTSTGATITSYVDTWDSANNRLSRVEQDGTLVTWSHDATYQLTRERRNGAHSYDTTYAYDPAGNRLLKLDNAIRTTYSYDAANQLQKYVDNTGTTTFAFDANGNQRLQTASSGGGTTTNTWDFENRLTTVALPSGILNTFAYNGHGLRVERQDSSGTLKQIWDGQKIVEETDQNNVVQVVYTHSAGVYGDMVNQRQSGTSSYFAFDPLGSTARLTDGGQNVLDTYIYKAFGEVLLSLGATVNRCRYLGRIGYSTDPDLMECATRYRVLRPAIGRWMSLERDWYLLATNGFRYCENRPLTLVDPSGNVPTWECVDRQTVLVLHTPRTVLPPTSNDQGPQGLVIVTSPVMLGDCGAFKTSATFWLKVPAGPNGGFVCQHVRETFHIENCRGQDETTGWIYLITGGKIGNADGGATFDFWEAFAVNPRATFAGDTDTWQELLAFSCTRGSILISADAEFIQGPIPGPPVFITANPETNAHEAPSTVNDPFAPVGPLQHSIFTATHKLLVKWDCCCLTNLDDGIIA